MIHPINYKNFTIDILRLDLLHPEISGNKWFKLKYNLQQAKLENKNTIVTFGGAFSNHIAATASACKLFGFNSVGIIRGEKESATNTTLSVAKQNGMQLNFVTREEYKLKATHHYINELVLKFPEAYIIAEGGDNDLGQKGCADILTTNLAKYNTIFCAYGTGTTFKGIAQSLTDNRNLIGINVLKYLAITDLPNTTIINDYHFGGYAKHTNNLLEFKNWFETTYKISLDYVYTLKLFYAVFDLINQNKFNTAQSILIIHSGGLQGNNGYEQRYNLNPNRQVNDAQGIINLGS